MPGQSTIELVDGAQAGFSLGRDLEGREAGRILFESSAINADTFTPGAVHAYSFSGNVVAYSDSTGLRQVVAPQTFVDVKPTGPERFSMSFYRSAARGPWNAAQRRYDVIEHPSLLISRVDIFNPTPGTYEEAALSVEEGGQAVDYLYSHDPIQQEWTLDMADGLSILKERKEQSGDTLVRTRTLFDKSGQVASETRTEYTLFPWGGEPVIRRIDPDGGNLMTRFEYQDNAAQSGYSRLRFMESSDGSWTRLSYDAEGRVASQVSGAGDASPSAPSQELTQILSSYAPLSSEDAQAVRDSHTPRTLREIVHDREVARTYNVISENAAGDRVIITERCTVPGAAFGDAANRRTVSTFHRPGIEEAWRGRIKSLVHPDGRLERRFYEYGAYVTATDPAANSFVPGAGKALRTTTINGTTNAPDGVAYKTTREVLIEDEWGAPRYHETYVYTGSGYERVSWSATEVDEFGRPTHTVASDGRRTEGQWGCCGLELETDTQGLETDYVYDDLKRLATQTSEGKSVSYTRDAAARVLSETVYADGLALASSNAYDQAGRLIRAYDSAGLETAYAYADGGRITTVTLPGGGTRLTENYLDGRLKAITGTAVIPQFYTYGVNADGSQWTKIYTGPDGEASPAWEKTTTDPLGRTLFSERPGANGSVLTNLYHYDAAGRLVRLQSTGNPDTLYEYDDLGNQVRSGQDIDANGALDPASTDIISETQAGFEQIFGDWWAISSGATYPEAGQGTILTNGITRQRLTGLGTGGLVSESVRIDIYSNAVTTRTWIDRDAKTTRTAISSPVSILDAESLTVTGLVRWTRSATGVEQTYAYDPLGRQTRSETTYDTRSVGTITHYNPKGQLNYTEDLLGNRTTFTYDPTNGRRIATTDALGQTTYTAYDIKGQVLATWGATYPVAYEYDDFNRMVAMYTLRDTNIVINDVSAFSIHHSAFDRTAWQYDQATGLLTNKLDATGQGPSYAYENNGRLATRTWARGIATDYAYDPAGRLATVNYSDATPDVTYTYDRLGRQVTITDILGTRTNSYDPTTLTLNAELLPDGQSINRTYDLYGRPSGLAHGNYAVAYAYDPYGRFTALSSSVYSAYSAVTYSYLPGSDLLEGYAADTGLAVTYDYEPNRNLRTRVRNTHNGSVVSSFRYEYDPIARRTNRIDEVANLLTAVTNMFGYNHRSEVIAAAMGSNDYGYVYDPIGNRVESSIGTNLTQYLANELNQYLSVTSALSEANLSYDPDGNLTNDSRFAYTWDGENRLLKAEPLTPVEGSKMLENQYDYKSRRISKVVSVYTSGAWTPDTTRTFTYDGWNLLSETGSTTNFYIWGLDLSGSLQGAGGVGGLLAVIRNGTAYYACMDANGQVSDYVTTDGTIAAHYEYDPYGNTTHATGLQADSFTFRFSTKYLDTETGLYYYGYRFMSTEIGRWLSRDPLGEKGGINSYSFVQNAPIKAIDVLGLWKATEESKEDFRRIYLWENGDTLQSLAEEVGLEYNEMSKWAKVGFDLSGALREPFSSLLQGSWKQHCYASVPNVWISADLLRGTPRGRWFAWPFRWPYYRVVIFGGTIGRFVGTDVFTHGFKVVKPNTPKDLEVAISSNAGDVWGLVIFAHGNEYGIISDSTMRNWTTQMELFRRIDKNGFKLAKAYPLQCYSGFSGQLSVYNLLPFIGFVTPLSSHMDANGNAYWTMQVDWNAQWTNRAIESTTYEGMNVIGIDF